MIDMGKLYIWENLKCLLENVKEAKIHEPVHFSKKPTEYFSLQITDSPFLNYNFETKNKERSNINYIIIIEFIMEVNNMMMIPIQNIYKICNVGSKHLNIFLGGYTSNLDEILDKNIIESIKVGNIQILYSDLQIYKTDSLKSIKLKLSYTIRQEASSNYRGISIDIMYIYGSQRYYVDIKKLYKQITNNEDIHLMKEILGQFSMNFIEISQEDIDNMEIKDEYTFEDIIRILKDKIDGNGEILLSKPMGIDDIINDNTFVSNSFLVSNSIIISNRIPNNDNILLNYFPLCDSSVHLCIEQDAVAQNLQIKPDYIRNVNFTRNKKLDDLDENKMQLFKVQDMFHNVYYSRTSELPYDRNGIESFEITLLNGNDIIIQYVPLESIFKNIHATKNIKCYCINFHPGIHKENILRLYSESISNNGKMIPVISKREIEKVHARMNKSNSLSAYIVVPYDDLEIELHIDITKEVFITVLSECKQKPPSYEKWNLILQTGFNPLIKSINNYLNSSGFFFRESLEVFQKRAS